jgi:hypothetical protein
MHPAPTEQQQQQQQQIPYTLHTSIVIILRKPVDVLRGVERDENVIINDEP